MKFEFESPDGKKETLEVKPISGRWFQTVCGLVAFRQYVELTKVIVSMNDFFVLLWFFGLTLAMAGLWAWKN